MTTPAPPPRIQINAVCVIGHRNQPLYIRGFGTTGYDQLHFNYVAHISVDIIEERLSGGKTTDLYLGLLHAAEDYAVYGYVTNTRVKFLLVIQLADFLVKDAEIKAVFRRIHQAYVNLTCNPFYDPEGNTMISNKSFLKAVEDIVVRST
ncbi:hypothetical protein SeMB42_g04797 [Synchytrium endobioticum]|uniref:Trafficking protein particle complex subunit 2-like protein n=1 Tax=Synchytrium endobioticum TaxID=286115 RepID=A0A507DCB5_9FUNG|nr:hypothetical protein SeMB42_g04797 [Synchytrium endobioticum]TPX49146.1 hypothetical protein SeLEV6574_g01635 [Synchytrium endobioticum]